MAHVAISSDFLTAFSQIPRAQQKKVREFLTRFQINPTAASIHYEPLHDTRDDRVRTVRIDLDYRAVVLHPQKGDVFLLAWVDHHDEAMKWARNKVFQINPNTGSLQVWDTQIVQANAPVSAPAKSLEDYGPYESLPDSDLLRTGLPAALLPAVRALRNADALDTLQPFLPTEAYEALYWIGHLGYSVDQALAEITVRPTSTQIDPDDLETALDHPDSRRRFVVVKTADDLVEMLNAPLEKWRIFLHPTQASLVQKNLNGPARVLGGAGTGKTVVAMHRARYLAKQVFNATTDRILFTTYTKNLATNIRTNLASLCGPEIERIEVVHLHSWAAGFLNSQGIKIDVATRAEVEDCWRNAFSAIGTGEWTEDFFRNEWERVVQAQSINRQTEYLVAPRTGQTSRLTRPQRAQVWQVFDEYKHEMSTLGKVEWIDLIRQTRLFLAQKPSMLPYRAVIVDETQDWTPEDLRLIRRLVPEGTNDLFLVGDAHQRIYGRPVVLGQCGINIRGRSYKLRINYRTTDEIRTWSLRVLTQQSVDDLDGGIDSTQGYMSLLSGEPPIVKECKTLVEEQSYLVERIKTLSKDAALETICLVARTNRQLVEDYLPAVNQASIPGVLLQADVPEQSEKGVRLATMHRVKGLEFAHVLMAGMNDGLMPLESARSDSEDMTCADSELQERCLFHVAATRARDTLSISCYGTPSRFINERPSS